MEFRERANVHPRDLGQCNIRPDWLKITPGPSSSCPVLVSLRRSDTRLSDSIAISVDNQAS